MSDSEVTRRDFLGTLTGAAATTWLNPSWSDLHAAGTFAAATPPQNAYQVLTKDQVRELDAVTAQLVPTDDLPGAREARVVRFIDRSLATWAKDQRPALEGALKELGEMVAAHFPGATSFAALGDEEQIALLKDWENARGDGFGTIHSMTILGMFSNPEYGGNYGKAGWKILGFKDQFSWAPPFGYYDRA